MSRRRDKSIVLALGLAGVSALAGLGAWWWMRGGPAAEAPRGQPVIKKVQPFVASTPFGGVAQVSLLAGDGHPGLRDGPAAQAQFSDPYGLARDADGNLFVADGGDANSIRRISPQGLVTTLAGTGVAGDKDGPSAQAQFNGPLAVAVDPQGRIYVADSYNDRIRVISPEGQVTTLAGGSLPGFQDGEGSLARFDTPSGLALDTQGQLWVADSRNDAIRRVTPTGQVTTLLRNDPEARPEDEQHPLRRPLALAATPDGYLYVSVMRRGAILQISSSNAEYRLLSSGPELRFARPTALALDPAGVLYLADAGSYRLHKLLPQARSAAAQASRLLDGAIGPAADIALPETAKRWPLAPQQAWHEVVGTPGEVRGNYRGESRDHLHEGLDVRGDAGSEVLAMADAKVSSPLSTWSFGGQGEGLTLDRLSYIHMKVGRDAKGAVLDPARFILQLDEAGKPERMRVRVRRGTRFAAGEKLGAVNSMAHVHLALGVGGYQLDPQLLGFSGMRDKVAPVIEAVELYDASGRRLGTPVAKAGKKGKTKANPPGPLLITRDEAGLQIVVEAWDQVDDNEPRRRLGLHRLGYQILLPDGRPAPGFEQPRVTQNFACLPVDDEAVKVIYAASSGITAHGSAVTRFRYVATNTALGGQVLPGRWQTQGLPAGDYILRILALDFAGNQALRGRDLRLRLE